MRRLTSYPGLVLLGLLGVLAVSACTAKEKRVAFDGIYFRTKAKAVDRRVTVADFRVEVKDAQRSLDAARQAGAYAGTRYCIENYGSSQIVWSNGPKAEAAKLVFDRDTLILNGVCQKP
ncbi:hypothetical protein [Pseudodonghicola xiamenensis]|nr:hypothetical protein [Pseudodonghicola xiamenensis]